MTRPDPSPIAISPAELARIGEGVIAYVRPIRSEQVKSLAPGAPDMPDGLDLYALLGAGGQPILITDSPAEALSQARESNLVTVSVH
jgi:hypothetical protein